MTTLVEFGGWGDDLPFTESDLCGEMVVDASADANRTASFVVCKPLSQPLSLIGLNVVLVMDDVTVFDGVITRVEHNPDLQIAKISLSDNSRETLNGWFSDLNDLDDLVYDGVYHPEIHGPKGTPVEYLDDLLSTVNQPFWFHPDDWDFYYGYRSGPPVVYPAIDGTLSQIRESGQGALRGVNIAIEYRFSVNWQYGRTLSWYGGGGNIHPAAASPESKWWPTYSGVESALGSTGCKLLHLKANAFNLPTNTQGLVYSFNAKVGHRWVESYAGRAWVSVNAGGHGSWLDEAINIDKTEQADQTWLSLEGVKQAGSGLSRQGYSYDRNELQGIIDTARIMAERKIAASRADYVVFDTPLNADIGIAQPAAAQCRSGVETGYVDGFVHTYSFDTGSAVTQVTLKQPDAPSFSISPSNPAVKDLSSIIGTSSFNIKNSPYISVTQVGRENTGNKFEVEPLHIVAPYKKYGVL